MHSVLLQSFDMSRTQNPWIVWSLEKKKIEVNKNLNSHNSSLPKLTRSEDYRNCSTEYIPLTI